MARPNKVGLDYFPHACEYDEKFNLVHARHPDYGHFIICSLWQSIYKEEGYYRRWEERDVILFSHAINRDMDRIIQVVDECFKWDLFSAEKYKKYGILTSGGIQRRYFEAVKKRKNVEVVEEYLIDGIKLPNNAVFVDIPNGSINPAIERVNVELTGVNVELTAADRELIPQSGELSTQSKVKETRVEESRLSLAQTEQENDAREDKKRETAERKKQEQKIQEERFRVFWEAYPRKASKKATIARWQSIRPNEELFNKIIAAVEKQKRTVWRDKETQFVPHPSTWLNQERWTDEVSTTTKPINQGRPGTAVKEDHEYTTSGSAQMDLLAQKLREKQNALPR